LHHRNGTLLGYFYFIFTSELRFFYNFDLFNNIYLIYCLWW
jgi:hypothetical protein